MARPTSRLDARGDKRCRLLQRELPRFLTATTGLPARLVDNGSALADFVMLATAPTLIGSVSTFSLAAAACNRHGLTVLPRSALFFPCRALWAGLHFQRTKFVPFTHGQQCDLKRFPLLAKDEPPEPIIRALVNAEGTWDGFQNVRQLCPPNLFKARAWRRARKQPS